MTDNDYGVTEFQETPDKKSRTVIWIIIAVVVAVVLCCCALVALALLFFIPAGRFEGFEFSLIPLLRLIV